MPGKRGTVTERWLRFIQPLSDGCWHWIGNHNGANYGTLKVNGLPKLAHVISFEMFVGFVPRGLELDHVCHSQNKSCEGGKRCPHRRCVNPDHLEPVTHRINVARGRGPRNMGIRNTEKRKCPDGHPYEGANLLMESGRRRCRVCRQGSWRRSSRKYQQGRANG